MHGMPVLKLIWPRLSLGPC